MKVWKNESSMAPRYYYSANFYDKTQDGEELRKKVYIQFQHGTEPADNLDGDFYFRTTDGIEYNVILKAYKNKEGIIEPKFMFWQGDRNQINNSNNIAADDIDDDLPF